MGAAAGVGCGVTSRTGSLTGAEGPRGSAVGVELGGAVGGVAAALANCLTRPIATAPAKITKRLIAKMTGVRSLVVGSLRPLAAGLAQPGQYLASSGSRTEQYRQYIEDLRTIVIERDPLKLRDSITTPPKCFLADSALEPQTVGL